MTSEMDDSSRSRSRLLDRPHFFSYHVPMKTRSIEVDDDTAAALTQRELERRWKAFEAQESVAANDDVVRWLQTWGTPAFRSWRKQPRLHP
jgi:predicted transcriptional regulator